MRDLGSGLFLILLIAGPAWTLEEPEDNLQATWDDNSMMPIIWSGEASHVTPTYLPPPNIGGEYGVTRLPDDYYFLPISSPIQRSQCVFPCTLRTQPEQTSFYGSSAAGGEVSGSASEQEDKVIVIHEHHHHHHHRNVTDEDPVDVLETSSTQEVPFYTEAPSHDFVDPPSFYTGEESRNEASESQQHFSKESMDNNLSKKKAFKNFFYKFYESLRRRAAQEKQRQRYNEEKAAEYDNHGDYDDVEEKEASDAFGDGFKAIRVHTVEVDPFIEEGFEPILEYELD